MRLVISCVVAIGCAGVPQTGGDDAIDDGGFSPLAHEVVMALHANHAGERGTTWDLTTDNTLGADWLIQTPPAAAWDAPLSAVSVATPCTGEDACDPDFDLVACTTQADCTHGGTCTPVRATIKAPGDSARRLCVGHSDAIVDQVYDLVTGAEHDVDFSSLEPPDGRFTAALRNAITFLAKSGRAVEVRLIYGVIPGSELAGATEPAADVLADLTRDLPQGSAIQITVAGYRSTVTSWDHAKILAADHRTAILGGHNLLTRHYLQAEPVYDLSLEVTGSAAAQASRFADQLWRYVCAPGGAAIGSSIEVSTYPADATPCTTMFAAVAATLGTGTTRLISLGRLGSLGDNASDDALVALIDAATSTLEISQQDLGGLAQDWPEPIVHALVAALGRGVDIDLVISNVGACPDGLGELEASYSNGWTPADVEGELASYADAHPELAADASARCTHLHVARLSHGSEDAWPSGMKLANHAKVVIADAAAFYLGSQNLYPSNLAELGVIVDDAAVTAQLRATYFAKLWSASARATAACR